MHPQMWINPNRAVKSHKKGGTPPLFTGMSHLFVRGAICYVHVFLCSVVTVENNFSSAYRLYSYYNRCTNFSQVVKMRLCCTRTARSFSGKVVRLHGYIAYNHRYAVSVTTNSLISLSVCSLKSHVRALSEREFLIEDSCRVISFLSNSWVSVSDCHPTTIELHCQQMNHQVTEHDQLQ